MRGKAGIYQIKCIPTGNIYVGSSKDIPVRWKTHRRDLGNGKSNCRHLQNAWTKYGPDAFAFSILDECPAHELEAREQHYIDTLRPALNCVSDVKRRSSPAMLAKRAASLRARAALITRCPRGHAYDEANTRTNKKGKRQCRACAAARIKIVLANETPEQREHRRLRVAAEYMANREKYAALAAARRVLYIDEKREYDRLRRERLKKGPPACSP